MGESVKISELVKNDKLQVLVKDYKNPTGDIGIEIIGLRPGEKLYEELLIGDDSQKQIIQKFIRLTTLTYHLSK